MSTALIRKIHVGCRQLGLDTEARRDLQRRATGKDSLKGMAEGELKAVLTALENAGFAPAPSPRRKPAASRADIRYAHVLWRLLSDAGATRRPGRDGLNAFIRSRFEGKWGAVPVDIDAMRDGAQINDVIRALKDMCRRAGIPTERDG